MHNNASCNISGVCVVGWLHPTLCNQFPMARSKAAMASKSQVWAVAWHKAVGLPVANVFGVTPSSKVAQDPPLITASLFSRHPQGHAALLDACAVTLHTCASSFTKPHVHFSLLSLFKKGPIFCTSVCYLVTFVCTGLLSIL